MERKVVPSSRLWAVGRWQVVHGSSASGSWFRMRLLNAKVPFSFCLSPGCVGYRGCNRAREDRRIPILFVFQWECIRWLRWRRYGRGCWSKDSNAFHTPVGCQWTDIEGFRFLTPCAFHAARLSLGFMISSVTALLCECYADCSQIRWSCVSRLR